MFSYIDDSCPPAAPENEKHANPDSAFAAARRAEIEAICKGPVRWEMELFTHSQKFGLIWRGDFWELKRQRQRYPTRVVCWNTDDGGLGTFISHVEQNGNLEPPAASNLN